MKTMQVPLLLERRRRIEAAARPNEKPSAVSSKTWMLVPTAPVVL
jgi:hypothetical protein